MGLMRQFSLRGARFNQLSCKEIKQVQTMLNDRSAKVIQWHSLAHTFHQLVR
jgi:IS30 family transposase